jgi:hypothetical protein
MNDSMWTVDDFFNGGLWHRCENGVVHHVACSYNALTGEKRYYVNGVELQTRASRRRRLRVHRAGMVARVQSLIRDLRRWWRG